MTDNAQSIAIEELVLTLHALIEQQQELLVDSQAQSKTNDEHVLNRPDFIGECFT